MSEGEVSSLCILKAEQLGFGLSQECPFGFFFSEGFAKNPQFQGAVKLQMFMNFNIKYKY